MSNIKQFNTPNGEKVGLNLTQIGTYIEVDGTEKELKQYIDENAGGGSEIVQNYKGLITDPNTELIKAGDLGYNEVVEYAVKYSKYFTFPQNSRSLYLKFPSGAFKNFLKVQKSVDVYDLYVNKLNDDGTYTWELIQDNLQGLPELTKVPFTYIFYDETHSQNVEFNGEFAWSLDRQEIYYTSTVDGWIPELKMKGMTEWNEGFYDISEPQDISKKQGSLYVKNSDGNVINVNANSNSNSTKKAIKIKSEWQVSPEQYIDEISAAYNEIKEGITKGYEVVVFTNLDGSNTTLQLTNIKESDNKQSFEIKGFVNDNTVITISIGWDGDSANKNWFCIYDYMFLLRDIDIYRYTSKYVPSVYDYDSVVNLQKPIVNGVERGDYVYQFINKAVVNENFYVVKTTIQKWDGNTDFNEVYTGVFNNYNAQYYYITKISGFRLDNNNMNDANYDLLPDGQWYIIGSESDYNTLKYCFVAKAVVIDNGNLDVYFGAYASNEVLSNAGVTTITDFVENYLEFYDCTVNNKAEQGNGGRRSEKNWVVVNTENIKVDAFDALATYRFIPNPAVEGVIERISCFKRR